MLEIEYETIGEGMERLKDAVATRDKMRGDLYWRICEDDCLKLADKLSADGVDKDLIAAIGGWQRLRV